MPWLKARLPAAVTGLMLALLILALGRSLFLFLDYMRQMVAFPFNVDYGEGPILDQVMRLAKLQSIYPRELSQLPLTIGNYPPLYHLLQLPFALLFGPAFWYGRVLNLVSVAAAATLVGLTVRRLTGNRWAAVVSGLLLPAFPVLHWAGFVRVDCCALALSWAGIYALVRRPEQRGWVIVVALFLTAAIYTRQSYGLAAPFAAFVWLLSRKQSRQAFALALWTGGFSLGLFLLLNLLTGGGFYFNIITSNINPFFWDTVWFHADAISKQMALLLAAAAVYLLAAAWTGHRAWWFAAPYLLAAIASAITIGKDGSNVNYLFELMAALAVTTGLFLDWLGRTWEGAGWRDWQWVGRRWWLVAAGLGLLVFQVNRFHDLNRQYQYSVPLERVTREYEPIRQLARLVAEADGPVLADEFMGLIPLAGKPVMFQPFEFKQLASAGAWDEAAFIRAVEQRRFALILLYASPIWDSLGGRWTPAQLQAIRKKYRPAGRLANTWLYVPGR